MGGFAEAGGRFVSILGVLDFGVMLAFVPRPSMLAPGSGVDIPDSCHRFSGGEFLRMLSG